MIVNGVPYPINVKDEETLYEWISSIDRPVSYSDEGAINGYVHDEVFKFAWFNTSNMDSKELAIAHVVQGMALSLFFHLAKSPKGELIWRIKPDFGIYPEAIPSDLSKVMDREKIDQLLLSEGETRSLSLQDAKSFLGLDDWVSDLTRDSIFPLAAPHGEWSRYAGYMRYLVHVDGVATDPLKRGFKQKNDDHLHICPDL